MSYSPLKLTVCLFYWLSKSIVPHCPLLLLSMRWIFDWTNCEQPSHGRFTDNIHLIPKQTQFYPKQCINQQRLRAVLTYNSKSLFGYFMSLRWQHSWFICLYLCLYLYLCVCVFVFLKCRQNSNEAIKTITMNMRSNLTMGTPHINHFNIYVVYA